MNGCLVKIREASNDMNQSEHRVARYILNCPKEVIGLAIGELALRCSCSKATVIRLCKSIGFKGYKDFRVALTKEVAVNDYKEVSYTDIHPSDSPETIAKSICMSNMNSLDNSLQILDFDAISKAVDRIISAKRVDFYGVGTSGIIALDSQYKFLRINKNCMALTDPHMQLLAAASLSGEDAAVFISYSGETRDIIDTLRIARQSGATLISITKYGRNSLSEAVDINLFVSSPENSVRSGAMGSRIAQLNMIDILYTIVASKEYPSIKKYLDRTRVASSHKKIGGKII